MIEWVLEGNVHEAYANGVWCVGCVYKHGASFCWTLDPILRGETGEKSAGRSPSLGDAKDDLEIEFRRFCKAAGVKLETKK